MDWVWDDTTKLLLTLSVTIAFGYVRKHFCFFFKQLYTEMCVRVKWYNVWGKEKDGWKEGRENQIPWQDAKQKKKG